MSLSIILTAAVLINQGAFGSVLWCELCKCSSPGEVDCKTSGLSDVPNANSSDPANFTAVYLDGNEISRVRTFPQGKLNVTVLSFRNNVINEVDNGAFRFVVGLKEIDFSDNHLASDTLRGDVFRGLYSPDGFEPLEVEVLRLSRNGLHTLDPDLFEHLPMLKELSLDGNPFEVIDHPTLIALANIPILQCLDLSRTKLNAIPENMLHTSKHLHVLNLSYNNFIEIPTSIESTHELQCLTLNGNPIEEIYSSPHLPSLVRLELSSMPKLRKIGSRALGNFTHLRELEIVNNSHLFEIAQDALVYEDNEIVPSMKTWPQITKLNISYNKLAFLESQFIANWEKIEKFGMEANPWVCDCTNQWFLVELIPAIHNVQPEEAKKLKCQDPIEMRGMSMFELSQRGAEMRCLDKYGHQPENDATTLIVLFIGMLFCLPILIGGLAYYKRNYWNSPTTSCSYQRTGSLETIYHH